MSQLGGVLKTITMPMVAITELKDKDSKNQTGGGYGGIIFSYLTSLIFMAFAGYLSWQCNVSEAMPLRIIYTLLAAIFNGFYLTYYFIYRYLMKNPC